MDIQKIILLGLLVNIIIYEESRITTLLPQVMHFLTNWIPTIQENSFMLSVALFYSERIIESAFHIDWHVGICSLQWLQFGFFILY